MESNGVVIFNSLNDVIDTFGLPHLDKQQLAEKGIKHILIRDNSYLRFGLVINKKNIIEMVNKNFSNIVREKIKGIVGVYGYLGVNFDLLSSIKEEQETDEKLSMAIVEFEGAFLTVNSGPLSGMVIVTEDIQKINFKTITS